MMRVDQLNDVQPIIKNMWVKKIPYKKKVLNYFLQDRFYPDGSIYGSSTDEKRKNNRYKSFYIV